MRLFLAIFPSKEFRDYYREVFRTFAKEKRNLKPINFEQIHLTLRFIGGDVSDHSKNQIINELRSRAGSYPKPTIEMESLNFGFPRQHDPRILFATIKGNSELEDLIDQTYKLVRQLRRRDTITWKQNMDDHYHMTLARLKPAATRSTGRDVKEILSSIDLPFPTPFVAEEMYVMQSTITPRGPVYSKLERIEL